jgi:hypothetical protein
VAINAASIRLATRLAAWLSCNWRWRSQRSAAMPANGAQTRYGSTRAALARPSCVAEPVSW